jgi:hypothetical protein
MNAPPQKVLTEFRRNEAATALCVYSGLSLRYESGLKSEDGLTALSAGQQKYCAKRITLKQEGGVDLTREGRWWPTLFRQPGG